MLGAEVAAVPGALAGGLEAPRPENKFSPAGAAAGVDDGVAEEVVPPREGNGDLAGVVVDVAGVEEEAGVVVVAALAGGVENSDVCGFCSPPPRGAPKRGFWPVSALLVGGVDSAGLSLPRPEKRLPPGGADGVEPSKGFCCVFDPKRPPLDCGCVVAPNSDGAVEELVAVVVAEGVVDEVVGAFPKRPPGFCAACPDCPKRDCP